MEPDPSPVDQPLSKRARKRLAKHEAFQARKAEKKAKEKAEKAALREKRLAGELDDVEMPRQHKRRRVTKNQVVTVNPTRVVIDLGFDDKMLDKEIVSLTSQLAYTYNSNKKSSNPFASLLITSLNGRTLARLDSLADAAYKRWTGVEWWTESYERLWEPTPTDSDTGSQPTSTRSSCQKENVVYLTADADDELDELRPYETYIIGGLCDHNRYKGLCLGKAKEQGIRAARLPIGKYITNLPTRKVLTVNQVFDILLGWVRHKDWEKAFYDVIPQRKFGKQPATVTNEEGQEQEVTDRDPSVGDLAAVPDDDDGDDEELRQPSLVLDVNTNSAAPVK